MHIEVVKKPIYHSDERSGLLCVVIVEKLQSTCYTLTHDMNVLYCYDRNMFVNFIHVL